VRIQRLTPVAQTMGIKTRAKNICLYMAIYAYIWPCMAIYGYIYMDICIWLYI